MKTAMKLASWCLLALLAASQGSAMRLLPVLDALVAPFAAAWPIDNSLCHPSQVHLAVTGDPSQMRVMWKTRGKSCATKVHYGEGEFDTANIADADRLLHHSNLQGSIKTYSAGDMCAEPANSQKFEPLILHDVVLSGLEPGKWYSYKVAHSKHIFKFQAPPPHGRKQGFSFLVYGDMGDPVHHRAKAPGAADTLKYAKRDVQNGANMVLHVGDIAYANGHEYVWDSFMDAIEPMSSRVPYMVAVGNHEYDYQSKSGDHGHDASGSPGYNPDWGNFGNDSGGECGVTVATRFSMPGSYFQGLPPLNNGSLSSSSSSSEGRSLSSSTSSNSNDRSLSSSSTVSVSRRSLLEAGVSSLDRSFLPAAVRQSDGGPSSETDSQAINPAAGPADDGDSANSNKSKKHRKPRAANPPFWYSYDYGSVHFAVVSSEHDLHKHSRQYKWLKADLKAVDRCKTPWVVLAMHRPMYVVYPHKSNRIVGEHLRKELEGLLNQYRVDLVLSGHVHSYARTCNVAAGKCVNMNSGGMTHITLGCGGHRLSDVNPEQPAWLVNTAANFGYGRVTVHDGYSLAFEYIRSDDGKVYDSYTLHNLRADANKQICTTLEGGGGGGNSNSRAVVTS